MHFFPGFFNESSQEEHLLEIDEKIILNCI